VPVKIARGASDVIFNGLAACRDSDDSREAPRALQKMGLLKVAEEW